MNYIQLLNDFNLFLITTPVSPNARSVYMQLLDLNNKLAWREHFSISNNRLAEHSGISNQQMFRARQQLIDAGLIEYIKPKSSKQAGIYKIVKIRVDYQNNANFNNDVNNHVNNHVDNQPDNETETMSITLNKQNKTKHNNNININPIDNKTDEICSLIRKYGKKDTALEDKMAIFVGNNSQLSLKELEIEFKKIGGQQ